MKRSRRPTSRNPHDFKNGISLYNDFHELDPNVEPDLNGLVVPKIVFEEGEVTWTYYKSRKWAGGSGNPEGKWHNYKHQHEAGVKLYSPDSVTGIETRVPSAIRKTETFVRLGFCLGMDYVNLDGEEAELAVKNSKRVELFCTPDRRHLVVIEDRAMVVAMAWGGFMHVAPAGITS